MTQKRKNLSKIYSRIMQIVTSCVDNYIEYYKYIDDLLDNNKYFLLQDVFSFFFKTDITKYNSVLTLKRQTYEIAKTCTNTYYQINLKGFYDANEVYQIGQKIYDTPSAEYLGTFIESYRLEEIYHNGVTYSYYPDNIYYRNTCLYHKLDEAKAIILNVIIGDPVDNIFVELNDPNMKLLDKYKEGVSLLKNGEINQYVDVDYIYYNYFI
jgi:hypothetical protein